MMDETHKSRLGVGPVKHSTNGTSRVGGAETEINHNKKSIRTVYVIFLSLLLDLLAFTIILPLLPSLLDYYAAHDESGLYNWILVRVHTFRDVIGAAGTRGLEAKNLDSVLFGGVIGSLFSLLQFLSSPIFGALSDFYGRKPILLFTMFGISISYGVWAMASSFSTFILARVIGGISKGNVSLSTAIVTDATGPEKRAKGMAFIGVAFSVGFVVGPMIGAFFSRFSRTELGDENGLYVLPALFALTLSLVNIIYIYFYYKESLPEEQRAASVVSGLSSTLDYINPLALFKFNAVEGLSPSDLFTVRRIGVIYFLYLFFYSGLEFTLTFLTHLRFNFTSMQQGKMFFFIGLLMALVQGGYVRRIKPGMEKKTAIRGFLVIVPAFILIGLASSVYMLYLGLALYSYASATVVPCLTTLVSTYGKVTQKGVVVGIFRSLGALARALGPTVASVLYWRLDAITCYMCGAVALLVPLLLLTKLDLQRKNEE